MLGSQVFLMLVTEMALFMLLVLPLPFTWRRKIFTFISESPIVAKLQYGMKVGPCQIHSCWSPSLTIDTDLLYRRPHPLHR